VLVQAHVKQGRPAKVLIEESANADLLVVGERGHGGFVGLVLGSVSQHVAAYAKCPVTVVH
jgi:nucleotide-binding universal stress UspA family protein